MTLGELDRLLDEIDVPRLTSKDEGRRLYEFVLESGVGRILELGFAHGTSTCYLAAALDERGHGSVTTIDRESARKREPSIEELVSHTGLADYVTPIFAATSYNWELMKMIQAGTRGQRTDPRFDFCFLDGAHTWETDGLAFFLVDKLLEPGSWILFDDVHWSYANSATLRDAPHVQAMPEEERRTPQVMLVFSLLAMQHPAYSQFKVGGNWAWVYKDDPDDAEPRNLELVERLSTLPLAR